MQSGGEPRARRGSAVVASRRRLFGAAGALAVVSGLGPLAAAASPARPARRGQPRAAGAAGETPVWPVDVSTAKPTQPWTMYATNGGRVELVTFGSDIWNSYDNCGFYYAEAEGDGVWTCRVGLLSFTKEWAKAGLMIRASTDSGSTNVDLCLTPVNGVIFQYRPTAHAPQQNGAGIIDPLASAPVYLKLQKQGNVYTAWDSLDGTNWVNEARIVAKPDIVGPRYLIGLCATSASYSGTKQGVAGFDRITGFTPTTYVAITSKAYGVGAW
jgi:hypothetical protein